jgi:predicted membrane protein
MGKGKIIGLLIIALIGIWAFTDILDFVLDLIFEPLFMFFILLISPSYTGTAEGAAMGITIALFVIYILAISPFCRGFIWGRLMGGGSSGGTAVYEEYEVYEEVDLDEEYDD